MDEGDDEKKWFTVRRVLYGQPVKDYRRCGQFARISLQIVFYLPARKELYITAKKSGFWKNGIKKKVSYNVVWLLQKHRSDLNLCQNWISGSHYWCSSNSWREIWLKLGNVRKKYYEILHEIVLYTCSKVAIYWHSLFCWLALRSLK